MGHLFALLWPYGRENAGLLGERCSTDVRFRPIWRARALSVAWRGWDPGGPLINSGSQFWPMCSTENDTPRRKIVELCRHFYGLGWVSGTGGGISIREGERVYMAPSGVQKERISEDELFVVNLRGDVLERPSNTSLKLSACAPLFLNAMRLRDAGAVIHSHSINAAMATLLFDDEFQTTHLEMQKGITGTGYHDVLRVPIIENTAHECDLADTLAAAIEHAAPNTHAVLVRRHGVYIWGDDWVKAKTHAECYDYLFEAAVKMKQLGVTTA